MSIINKSFFTLLIIHFFSIRLQSQTSEYQQAVFKDGTTYSYKILDNDVNHAPKLFIGLTPLAIGFRPLGSIVGAYWVLPVAYRFKKFCIDASYQSTIAKDILYRSSKEAFDFKNTDGNYLVSSNNPIRYHFIDGGITFFFYNTIKEAKVGIILKQENSYEPIGTSRTEIKTRTYTLLVPANIEKSLGIKLGLFNFTQTIDNGLLPLIASSGYVMSSYPTGTKTSNGSVIPFPALIITNAHCSGLTFGIARRSVFHVVANINGVGDKRVSGESVFYAEVLYTPNIIIDKINLVMPQNPNINFNYSPLPPPGLYDIGDSFKTTKFGFRIGYDSRFAKKNYFGWGGFGFEFGVRPSIIIAKDVSTDVRKSTICALLKYHLFFCK
ncbi:MAG: hypothetical protein JNL63_08570 [Bacteroidia bacterium]|nr:hypothetical protein [Bacteroidia bacterium]